jgi:hypothetical protein
MIKAAAACSPRPKNLPVASHTWLASPSVMAVETGSDRHSLGVASETDSSLAAQGLSGLKKVVHQQTQ